MAIDLSHSILWLFAISTLIFIIGESIHQQAWKTIKLSVPLRELAQFSVIVALVEAAFLALAVVQKDSQLQSHLFYVGGAFLPFILTRFRIPASVIGLILLSALIAIKTVGGAAVPWDAELCTLLGLIVFKSFENFFVTKQIRFDDIAAPVLWIAGSCWWASANFDAQLATQVEHVNWERNVLLAGVSIAYLVKLVKDIVGPKDKFFLRSLALSGAGGLALYLILEKVLLVTDPAPLSLFYAGGTFASSLLNAPREEGEDFSKLDYSVQFLVLIGILTLVATRLFGTFGLLLVGSSCLSAYFAGSALTAALFFASRVIFQAYEASNNSNVTGINLMHSYVGASLYAGILLTVMAALILVRQTGVWRTSLMFISLALLAAPLSNYFLHEEPTSGFLLAILTSSIIFTGLAPAIFKFAPTKVVDTLMLLPLFASSTALVTADLLTRGNESSLHDRIFAAAWVAAAIALMALFAQIIGKSKEAAPPAKVVKQG